MDRNSLPEQPDSKERFSVGIDKDQILAEVQDHGYVCVWVGRYETDRQPERDETKTINTINEVLSWFEIAEDWQKNARVDMNNGLGSGGARGGGDSSAGAYIVGVAPYCLDIECEEYGYGQTSVSFELDDLTIRVEASGDFWTDYTYTRKADGIVIETPRDPMELSELNGDDRYRCEGEVNYTLSFEMWFDKPDRA